MESEEHYCWIKSGNNYIAKTKSLTFLLNYATIGAYCRGRAYILNLIPRETVQNSFIIGALWVFGDEEDTHKTSDWFGEIHKESEIIPLATDVLHKLGFECIRPEVIEETK
jgi:hypothetical protein